MWSEVLTCGYWFLGIVALFVSYVVWSVVSIQREDKRKHQEIVEWAHEEREEREKAEKIVTISNVWGDIASFFPFLSLPEPESDDPQAVIQALARRLNSVPSLGTFSHAGLPAPLLPPPERRRHLYVVGKTGSGKTTFLEHLILRDLEAGHGVGVMAPEGELFRGRLLSLLPASRRDDVIYFAPGDPACPLTFNPLRVEEGDDALRAAEDLFTIFRRALSGDELGPRMQPILQNAFAVMVGRAGATLWDVKRFLTEPAFRKVMVDTTDDPYIREFWEETFPRFAKGADLPLLSRLDHFLRPPAVRRALCNPVSTVSIRAALLQKKVLLIDLFGLSEETQRLMGQMLLSKFQIELMRRELAGISPPPFFLFCDEFQTFAGFAEGVWRELLSRGRKYGLALTLVHQFPAQLPTALQEEIFGNVNSMIAFALGNKDAQVVRKELLAETLHDDEVRLEPVPIEELLELKTGQAYGKLAGGRAVKLFMPAPLRVERPAGAQEVIAASWRRYKAPPVPPPLPATPPAAPPPQPEPPPAERETRAAARPPVAPPPPPPSRTTERRAPPPVPALGRGGAEHKYLQELVKRLAEAKGFRVTVEQLVLDGRGSVDVALEREGWRLACEISVASTVEQEVGNVQKCLSAGFDEVVVVSTNQRHLGKLHRALSKKLAEETRLRVHLVTPEDLPGYLESLPAPLEKVETVGGYQVKVSYRPATTGEGQSRAKAVAGVIARSLQRMQGKKH